MFRITQNVLILKHVVYHFTWFSSVITCKPSIEGLHLLRKIFLVFSQNVKNLQKKIRMYIGTLCVGTKNVVVKKHFLWPLQKRQKNDSYKIILVGASGFVFFAQVTKNIFSSRNFLCLHKMSWSICEIFALNFLTF